MESEKVKATQTVDSDNKENEGQAKEEKGEDTLAEKVFTRLDAVFSEYFLNDFQRAMVRKFIRDNVARADNPRCDRIREWLFHKINRSFPANVPEMQRGCPEIIPGLRARPWWDSSEFPWLSTIEANIDVIRKELLSLRGLKGFQPYRGPSWASKIPSPDGIGSKSNDSGEWNVFYLFLHDMKFEENCAKCPETVRLIEEIVPRHYVHAFFSAVTTSTHILKHHGPTNKKLRLHVPLIGVEGSRMRVGTETRSLERGKVYVFDDSFEHEAWHDGSDTRVILIVDFWHPDLSTEEVKLLTLLQNARMRAERFLAERDEDKDNFYSIIETSKDILQSNDWWTVNEKDLA